MQNVVILNDIYAECRYTECRHAECSGAEGIRVDLEKGIFVIYVSKHKSHKKESSETAFTTLHFLVTL
jgi:hypothetical protein